MADEPENVMLVLLCPIDAKVDRLTEDMSDFKVRVTGVEEGLAGVNRRLDRLETCFERIERRLDLSEAPH